MQALREAHRHVFQKVAACSLEELVQELRTYVDASSQSREELLRAWQKLEPFRVALPMDVLDAPSEEEVRPTSLPDTRVAPTAEAIRDAAAMLGGAKRPIAGWRACRCEARPQSIPQDRRSTIISISAIPVYARVGR